MPKPGPKEVEVKKLILVGLVALGLVWAQTPYVGGHIGFLGVGGLDIYVSNFGLHAGVGLQGGLEVRTGADLTSISDAYIVGINTDVLMSRSILGSQAVNYVGFGTNWWLFPGGEDFGVHSTLGVRYPTAGAHIVPFFEVQIAYVYSGGLFYYLKFGGNSGF